MQRVGVQRRIHCDRSLRGRLGRAAARTAAIVAVAVVMLPTGSVFADAAGPTDFLSEVRSVTPTVEGVQVRIAGGDSFLGLAVDTGVEVIVPGYEREPYVRFMADGTVQENRRSPAFFLNSDRYARDAVPADVTAARATEDPDWVTVSRDGTWWWHDHRIHWMSDVPPLGLGPGDEVVDGVIPLDVTVDGATTRVEVRVSSVWQPAPSPVPVWVGALIGAALVAGWWVRRSAAPRLRWVSGVTVAGVVPGIAATVVGAWQYASLPSATAPEVGWWLLPATGGVAAGAAAVAAARGRSGWELTTGALLLVAGVQTGRWVLGRWSGLTRAVLPTDAPAWFDRAVTSGVAVAAVGSVVAASVLLVAFGRRLVRPVSPARR